MMKLYIDGDGCNARSRTLTMGFAMRGVWIELVSNMPIPVPSEIQYCAQYHAVVVGLEEGAVDSYVLGRIKKGDALITRDLAFAQGALALGACVASDYGERYDNESIKARMISSEARKDLRTYARDVGQVASGRSKTKKARQLEARLQDLRSFLETWMRNVM